MEWPEVLPPQVHAPRSGGPPTAPPRDLSHRASLERKPEGPCQEASVLTGVLQAAPGESGPRRSSRAQEGAPAIEAAGFGGWAGEEGAAAGDPSGTSDKRFPGRRPSGNKGRKQPGGRGSHVVAVSWGKSCLKLPLI